MKRKIWIIPLLLLLLIGQLWARPYDPVQDNVSVMSLAEMQETVKFIGPDIEFSPGRIVDRPLRDAVDEVAIGEDMIIGYTWYDYQHNGSIGKMIVRDGQSGTHFVWMCGYTPLMGGERRVLYNFLHPERGLISDSTDQGNVDYGDRSGYTCMSILPEDDRAVVFYHELGHIPDDPGYLGTTQSVDFMYGLGAFLQSTHPNPIPNITTAWPHGDVDQGNISHILSTEHVPEEENRSWQRVVYWRGEPDREFAEYEWNGDRVATIIDTGGVISGVAAASPQSNRVALAWHHNRIGPPEGTDWEEYGGAWQRNNDIRFIISEDGEDWDFPNNIESMTDIIPPNADLVDIDMREAYGDTFRPYTDVDIQFDPWEDEDNLYAVFAASGFNELPFPDDEGAPLDYMYSEYGHLWFWNSIEDTITMIANGWYNQWTNNPGMPENRSRRQGVWRTNCDRGSIAFNPDDPGTIYVVWVNFPHISTTAYNEDDELEMEFFENAQDTSINGYANAEIMVSISTDYGISWREPINVTETIWEGDEAPPPDSCMSENWSSVAALADDALHIMYIRDLDAGGIPQDEGSATNSPVIYHHIDLEDLPLNDLVAIPEGENGRLQWHNYVNFAPRISEIQRDPGVPTPDDEVQITATVEATGEFELDGVFLQYIVDPDEEEDVLAIEEIEMESQGDNIFTANIQAQEEGTYVWYKVRAVDDQEEPPGETIKPNGWWHSYVTRPEGGLTIRDVQYRPVNWTVDYSPYMGFEVTVTGVVTTPAEFSEIYGAFAIQDDEAFWSGLFVRGYEDIEDFEFPEIGTEVSVTGVVMELDDNEPDKWRFATYIDVLNIEELGHAGELEPLIIEVEDMTYSTHAEHLEGVLVHLGRFELQTFSIDDLDEDEPYIPITNRHLEPEEVYYGWLTFYGIDIDPYADDLALEDWRQGTAFAWMEGIFAENQHYAIAPRDINDFGPLAVGEEPAPVPYRLILDPVYPNPFNAVTWVNFELSHAGYTDLAIYDLTGRLVAMVAKGDMTAGSHSFTINASELATGVYILRLETENASASKKLVLMK